MLVSGRTSYELVQKAVTSGVGVLAGVSAPSSLAVQLASRFGLALAGFVRGGRFVLYTGELAPGALDGVAGAGAAGAGPTGAGATGAGATGAGAVGEPARA